MYVGVVTTNSWSLIPELEQLCIPFPIVDSCLMLNYSKAYCNLKSLVNRSKKTPKSPDFG